MKRIHLFEFEDKEWFPNWLRICLTRLIVVVHRMVGSTKTIHQGLVEMIETSKVQTIVDLCSGSGGPMIDVVRQLNDRGHSDNIRLILTDLYPNNQLSKSLENEDDDISYFSEPVDATQLATAPEGIKTMICSFHHMPPTTAREILKSVCATKQPFLIYEMSDNSFPIWLWWIAIPTNIIMCVLITPFVRPLTWQQILFTYLIPIIPITFAWDGAVSNARTYTIQDMKSLLEDIPCTDYNWKLETIKEKGRKILITGLPVH